MNAINGTGRGTPGDDMETELKLEIDPACAGALAGSAVLADIPVRDREQWSTYFDTSDHDLRAAGVSLRVRRTGDRHVQTVKAGGSAVAGMFARPEWENDVAGPAPELPADAPIRTLVTGDVLDRVAPIFTVRVMRRQWIVEPDGATIELVADQGEVTAADRQAPVSEIELELKSGSPAAMFALARALGQVAPLRLGVVTKAERGYRLIDAVGKPSAKAEQLELDRQATVAEAFAAIVGTCLRQFRLNEELLRQHPAPEPVHQARVALRRLRSALSIFRPIVADDRLPHLADELRWLAGSLGEARDLDVLMARVDEEGAGRMATAREGAYAQALAALDSQRARDLMLDLAEWTALGDWRERPDGPDQPARHFAAHALDRLRRRIKRRGRGLAHLSDHDRHRVRIQAKKLRYATGFFEQLFTGKKARRRHKAFLKTLETLQDHLGDLNDVATAPALSARHGLPVEDMPADRRDALLADAADARHDLLDAKRFWH